MVAVQMKNNEQESQATGKNSETKLNKNQLHLVVLPRVPNFELTKEVSEISRQNCNSCADLCFRHVIVDDKGAQAKALHCPTLSVTVKTIKVDKQCEGQMARKGP
ncbi:hypothetical protein OUZ56_030782 [Daphnia magna]|uniref:Uncharacterized protein n=1 Tax=Daphnia magna TaxID=35525 RepID=A0ABQ9ZSB3_9CRUS|nr:hypothetical protein OUZ56_030782 [Daphnia magna]